MIIDIHTHLGDILYPNGGKLIDKRNVRKKIFYDIVSQSEFLLHNGISDAVDQWLYKKMYTLVTRASRARNATATLENMRQSMDAVSVVKSACMPIPPYVTFDDLRCAQAKDDGVIPFTGIDYTKEYDIGVDLKVDVSKGAKGLKLHPIIQRVPMDNRKTFEAMEAFAPFRLPVLFHCGISSYYLGAEKQKKENAALGEIAYARELVAGFPNITFIAGHAGLYKYRHVMDLLGGFKNVMVDTSFQSPGHVRELLKVFGPERVMYASDWPFGNRKPAVKIVKKACRGDKSLEKRIFYENAASLLGD
ncbi:MAG: amidohydrolase family protein [Desulfobacteraceae bacterium]|nr:amidohydrolase family protein [Desulfobacteraceae bacterium]MBC2757581.1 amidohydrolase family protein [Desulfobacteraceae bacterium]